MLLYRGLPHPSPTAACLHSIATLACFSLAAVPAARLHSIATLACFSLAAVPAALSEPPAGKCCKPSSGVGTVRQTIPLRATTKPKSSRGRQGSSVSVGGGPSYAVIGNADDWMIRSRAKGRERVKEGRGTQIRGRRA